MQRVEQGTQLVDKAGSTMADIVTAIRRVTDIMAEISAASQEQSQGVAQVGEAVTQMDQTTQQNAALVEESAAAAGALRKQAQELVQAVAVFQLPPHAMHERGAHSAAVPSVASSASRPVASPTASAAMPAPRRPLSPKTVPQPAPQALTGSTSRKTSSTEDDWETF